MKMPETKHPLFLPVVHIAAASGSAGWRRAQRSVDLFAEAGADGLFFIDQQISSGDLCRLIGSLDLPDLPIGINLLGQDAEDVADVLESSWAKDVLGARHRMIWTDDAMPDRLARNGGLECDFSGTYFGGVGFKYRRTLPDVDVPGALEKCGAHVDYITTSGPATGTPPTRERLACFADALQPTQRLAFASGANPENLEHLCLDERRPGGLLAHAVLVASSLETSFGVVSPAKARAMGRRFDAIRRAIP